MWEQLKGACPNFRQPVFYRSSHSSLDSEVFKLKDDLEQDFESLCG